MTTNKKFLMMLAAGAAMVPSASTTTVSAAPPASIIVPAAVLDKAPTNNGRLRRTDEEQPGNEMPSAWFERDASGKVTGRGLYFVANTELPGILATDPPRRANDRIQGAMVPFTLGKAADGSFTATPDLAKATFITNNRGNEYRNFNASTVTDIVGPAGQHYAMVTYNFQDNNTNNTERWAQIYTADGVQVMKQTSIHQKNNDDCSMRQDGDSAVSWAGDSPNTVMYADYAGCNGNGSDDGWVFVHKVTFQSATAATIQKVFDVSVCPREERSRGAVRLTPDKKALIASWTEGNTQPQRDGTWMAAIDLTKGATGARQQQTIAWKQQIAGRVDEAGIRTYAMRMKMEQLSDQAGVPSNTFMIQYALVRGNNNTNGKGGTYYANNVGVVTADLTGLKYVVKPANMSAANGPMDGIDGTHLGQVFGNFGTTGSAVPGIAFLAGNQFGGGDHSDIRVLTFDAAAGTFKNAGNMAGGPSDRHLYPNYLGNNPGNQGRNHTAGQVIDVPDSLKTGTTATKLLVYATTAKAPGDLMKPEIKLAAWLTVLPIQSSPVQGGGSGSGSGSNPDPTQDPGSDPNQGGDSLGGCNAGGSAGLATFLLLGLAAFIRRRR